jgi:carboxypeptidase C (cathepsin A)
VRCITRFLPTVLLSLLAACGGGGGDAGVSDAPGALNDGTAYSSQPEASLPGAVEAVATTKHRLRLGGQEIAYTASAGHLIAREPLAGAAQASLFHVAYTVDGADPATRPVTFFYNGGPGSASVWLHLGSFGPKRLVTGVPATTATRPFPLVDNADSLLASTDMVFIDAVGSGRSQAIAPYRNRDFWSVGADAALFRDAIRRWLQMHGRLASPLFLYGESYGGPRTAVLARRLQEAGTWPAGLILQSPALDYNSNCGVTEVPGIACTGYLPSYAATGAWHGLSTPAPEALEGWLDGWLDSARDFAALRYRPAVQDWLAAALPAPELWQPLAALTGLPAAQWQQSFNLGPTRYRERLIPGQLLGRYDARMTAPVGSTLAAEGDPSSTWITASFAGAVDAYLRDTLLYRNRSTYVLLGTAIQHWDFAHAGRAWPDTVPDLAAALAADPALRVLAVSGVHDLATPFHVTENDLARLGSDRVSVRNYPGGHMSFLDDSTRPLQKADVAAFLAQATAGRALRRAPLAAAVRAAPAGFQPPDRAGVPEAAIGEPLPEPAVQAPLRDPWVPPRRVPGG